MPKPTGKLDQKRFDAAMRRKGFATQESLGKAIKVRKSTVSRWCNGKSFPGGVDAIKLCRALECSLSWLAGEDLKTPEFLGLIREVCGDQSPELQIIGTMLKLSPEEREKAKRMLFALLPEVRATSSVH